ncbi:hypothetical protein PAAG_02827 [Paracoccidioides lutzii Pb01]|uniref:Mid2 domain-containing protein n=1 Tax=Paracoccidioides lutzii (strain ATCC MYA-826 / Pb01) TaxID=502779 RepID=C1GWD2_PARBA|nr:hypothetical protein PAAG_02827 [Paracoccidioides lutzii Pb01]EEH40851.2 hypothetical protein PAAG_02827 [Paracoccidioides lutzii Pb01]
MRLPTTYILLISCWTFLSDFSCASHADFPLPPTPPCQNPLVWEVEVVAGVSLGKCILVSPTPQPVKILKILHTERQRRQLSNSNGPSKNDKRYRLPLGRNWRKRQFLEEESITKPAIFTFIPDNVGPSLIWEDEPTTTNEDRTEAPATTTTATLTALRTTAATKTSFTSRTSTLSSTPLATQTTVGSKKAGKDSGAIIAGCSIGGIALIAVAYLAFMAWRRSRSKKMSDELNMPPPPYDTPSMRGGGNPQTESIVHQLTPEQPPPAQSPGFSWVRASTPSNAADSASEQTRRQKHRLSRRFYAALATGDPYPGHSPSSSIQRSNPSDPQNRLPSNLSEPFTNLPRVTEESPSQERFPPAPPASQQEPIATVATARPLATYRSRRESRDNVRRSLLGPISRNNNSSDREERNANYNWQYVSYPNNANFDSHYDVSDIEDDETDSLPFGRQSSMPLTIHGPQNAHSSIRPSSAVSEDISESTSFSPSRV